MRLPSRMALCAAVWLATSTAGADEKLVCAEAIVHAQNLRDEAKLLEARSELRVCSRSQCPRFIADKCTVWLNELEIPSVVLSAKNGDGIVLLDVKVAMDGASIATQLDGNAVEVNPGLHTFVFQGPDGERVEVSITVKEGAKSQSVSVVIREAKPKVAIARREPKAKPDQSEDPSFGRVMRIVGYSAGGVGVIGLGIGGFFGLQALSKNSESKEKPSQAGGCDAQDFCGTAGTLARREAQMEARVSTIGFVAGGVLLAGGLALALLAPSNRKPATTNVAPMVGMSGSGLLVGGRF